MGTSILALGDHEVEQKSSGAHQKSSAAAQNVQLNVAGHHAVQAKGKLKQEEEADFDDEIAFSLGMSQLREQDKRVVGQLLGNINCLMVCVWPTKGNGLGMGQGL